MSKIILPSENTSKQTQTTTQNKRYRLHQIVKPFFSYCSRKSYVYLPANYNETDYPPHVRNALKSLQKLNYSLQTQIN